MKLKDFSKNQRALRTLGLFAFLSAFSAQAEMPQILNFFSKEKPSSTDTNASPSAAPSLKISAPESDYKTNRVRLDQTALEQPARAASDDDLGREERVPILEDQFYGSELPISFFTYNTPTVERVFRALRERLLDASDPHPLEFRGKSTAGHEFRLLITGQKILQFDIAQNASHDYVLETAIYFDGAGPTPILGRLYPSFSNGEAGAPFSGRLVAISRGSKVFKLDPESEINVVIDFNDTFGKFELKHFSIKANARTAEPISDGNETIATGGLDSGGGK